MYVKLLRNLSPVNLLFSVSLDSLLDSILVFDSRFTQELRIANQVKNRDSK